eukprot:6125960-Pyramimonas_sp.AAC.1
MTLADKRACIDAMLLAHAVVPTKRRRVVRQCTEDMHQPIHTRAISMNDNMKNDVLLTVCLSVAVDEMSQLASKLTRYITTRLAACAVYGLLITMLSYVELYMWILHMWIFVLRVGIRMLTTLATKHVVSHVVEVSRNELLNNNKPPSTEYCNNNATYYNEEDEAQKRVHSYCDDATYDSSADAQIGLMRG